MERVLPSLTKKISKQSLLSKGSNKPNSGKSKSPKLPPLKVKVSPNVIDDSKIALGYDFDKEDLIYPKRKRASPPKGALETIARLITCTKRSPKHLRISAEDFSPSSSSQIDEVDNSRRSSSQDSCFIDVSDCSTCSGSSEVINVNEEEDEEKDIDSIHETPYEKFQRIAKVIKNNLTWSRGRRSKAYKEENKIETFVVGSKDSGLGEVLCFNVANFQTKTKTYGGLTPNARRILSLPSNERNEEDLTILKEIFDRQKCFEKYSGVVKKELARVLHFERFEDGRRILKQGHRGESFYFIVRGGVIVRHSEMDERTGEKHSQIIGEILEGSSFGELALLLDVVRQASYFCKGESEFLRLDKRDFDEVLRRSYENEYAKRHAALMALPYFNQVPSNDLLRVVGQCYMNEVGPNKILAGETEKLHDHVTYILQGEVKVVREVYVWRQNNKGRESDGSNRKTIIPSRQEHGNVPANYTEEQHLITLFHVKKGDYFCASENLRHAYIISVAKVEYFDIPMILYNKFGLGGYLETLKFIFDSKLPPDHKVLAAYAENEKWKEFKRLVIADVVSRRCKAHHTTLSDVPMTIRLHNSS